MISDVNIKIDRDLCFACGNCVDRCIMDNLRLSVAPCRQACPLNLNCQGYVRLIAQGKEELAAQELRKYTPFAGILGAVCSRPCESACERGKTIGDGAVQIRALKRYLAAKYPEIVETPPEVKKTSRKTCVVGSGPAGLAAAYEMAAAGHEVAVYEAAEKPGGFLLGAIPAFRMPEAELKRALDLLGKMGVSFKTGFRLGENLELDQLEKDYEAVVLALGAGKAMKLNVPGEDLEGVFPGLDLLAKARNGLAEDMEGREVVVIGGGNTAVDSAVTCLRLGAAKVTMLCLEGPDQMPAHAEELALAQEEGVHLLNCLGVTGIRAQGDRLALDLSRCLRVFDGKGVFAPLLTEELKPAPLIADQVVVAVGQTLQNSGLDQNLEQENKGRLAAEPYTQKSPAREKVFVAGDCLNGPSSVVRAMASGKEAGISANRLLAGLELDYERDFYLTNGLEKEYVVEPERARDIARTDLDPKGRTALDGPLERNLNDEQAKREAERCLSCGRSFELNKTCWYCLPCEVDCPVEALEVRMPYQVR